MASTAVTQRWEQIWKEEGVFLYRYVRHACMSCPREHVEDVLQEIAQAIGETLQRESEAVALPPDQRSYLLGVAKHKVSDHFRREHTIHKVTFVDLSWLPAPSPT